jgi:hypothetical protein
MSTDRSGSRETDSRDDLAHRQALFPGLVYNLAGQEARVVMVGAVAHYAIPDDGFLRHVEADLVDRAVIMAVQEQMNAMREEIIAGMLQMMGTDDILAKAAIEASLSNVEHGLRQSDPSQWTPILRLYGFRIIVDVHGRVQEIIFPAREDVDPEE